MIGTEAYDNQFQFVAHYQRHPQLLPFVGTNYSDVDSPRVLFVAESHYLPHDSVIHRDSSIWYESTAADLSPIELQWTTTRIGPESGVYGKYKAKAHLLFRNLEAAVLEAGVLPAVVDSAFRYLGFMNFFQRPAHEGKSLRPVAAVDETVAKDTLSRVVDVLEPRVICFVSRHAWRFAHYLRHRNNQNLDERQWRVSKPIFAFSTPHPSCSWWNRAAYTLPGSEVRVSGKQLLVAVLRNKADEAAK